MQNIPSCIVLALTQRLNILGKNNYVERYILKYVLSIKNMFIYVIRYSIINY